MYLGSVIKYMYLGSVIKYMAGNLDLEDEDKFQSSLNQLVNQFPRYR